MSTNALSGKFELMMKVYPGGKLSQHLDTMPIGESVDFKHIPFNVKIQYPFNKAKIGMLVGGTGITPMIQALHAVLGTEGDSTAVSMLYGSQKSTNILATEVLDEWSSAFPGRLDVTHVLSAEPEGSSWTGPKGFITPELIAEKLPGPSEDCLIFVCGPPPMYDALCGPRGEAELSGALKDMGYAAEQVIKF